MIKLNSEVVNASCRTLLPVNVHEWGTKSGCVESIDWGIG
jgi:hypothetical protein